MLLLVSGTVTLSLFAADTFHNTRSASNHKSCSIATTFLLQGAKPETKVQTYAIETIERRNKMKFIVAALASLATLSSSPFPTAAADTNEVKKNNLLVILTDQQRYDTIRLVQEERGWPEQSRIQTPNLDRIAREGAYFRNAYTHCAVCVPARASFLTGSTIESTGVRTNNLSKDENLPGSDAEYKLPNLPTYDRVLVEKHDYVAEYYGKWHTPNSMAFGVYNNDVRRGAGAKSWFGKYNDDGTKHYSWGMTEWYRMWLEDQPTALDAKLPFDQGDQINTYSKYFYDPDPLDTRYGMETDAKVDGVRQPDQHGVNRLEDGLSNTAQQAGEMIEALERLANGDKPFSLHLSLHSPHAPMIPTKKYYDMYNPDDMAVPASLKDDMDNSAYSNDWLPEGYDDPAKVQRWTANYFGLITEVDDWMGKILDKLDELGITENTLLAFSADHGEMLGGHGMREKNNFYEESSRVPLLLRMPGKIPEGTVVDDPVSHLDLHSTFLDYSVGRTDYKSDGATLRSHIEGFDTEDSFVVTMWNYTEAISGYKPSKSPAFMIRKGNWKLVLSGQEDNDNVDMLYNLDEDPSEVNNLIGKNGNKASNDVIGKAEHLKAMLVKYLKDSNHPAAGEIQRRRTWRDTTFWSDFALDFRDTLSDGTRIEYLYIGSPDDGTVSLSLEGEHASRYGLKLDSQHGLNDKGFSVVAVRYSGSDFVDTSPASLVVKLDNGKERRVVLNPPRNIRATARMDGTGDNTGFSDRLSFSLDLTEAPTRSPTNEPTAGPTITMEPTASPTVFTTCSGPSELGPNERLYAEEEPNFICSPNGLYRFGMASDGDLSLWLGSNKLWSANTCCRGSDAYVVMQKADGNLVMRSYVEEDSEDEKAKAHWASRTEGEAAAVLKLDDDGQASVIATDGKVLWKTDAPEPDQSTVAVSSTPSPEKEVVVNLYEPPRPSDDVESINRTGDASVPSENMADIGEFVFEEEKVAGATTTGAQQRNISTKGIGAAIAIVLSMLAFVIAFVIIRRGSKMRTNVPPPPPSSSQSVDNKDGAFPVGARTESGMDTSIDTASQIEPNNSNISWHRFNGEYDGRALSTPSQNVEYISRQRSGIEVVLPAGDASYSAPGRKRTASYDLSPVLP